MKLDQIEAALTEVTEWTTKAKAALDALHAAARQEAAVDKAGPYRALERKLFGDPSTLLDNHEEKGPGFGASLMDGPSVDYFSLAGLDDLNELSGKIWNDHNWIDIVRGCSAVFDLELYEIDGPGISDTYYWIRVDDADELARQLREFIVGVALEPRKVALVRTRRK